MEFKQAWKVYIDCNRKDVFVNSMKKKVVWCENAWCLKMLFVSGGLW